MNSEINLLSPIVSVEWLYNNLKADNLILLDATINKVFNKAQSQIPSARFFDIKRKFSDTTNPFPSAFPSEEQFQNEARLLGISNHNAIVVYDDKGIYSSARVWWLFKCFGHHNIAVLNGGFPKWLKAECPVEPMSTYKGNAGNFTAKFQPNLIMFFDGVKNALEDNTYNIIDARSAERFNCEVPEPRAGLRRGTIPNSKNVPYTTLLEDGVLKSKMALQNIFYNTANKNNNLIFSCGSGITACILALGAEISGYKKMAVYDGSWTEWGSLTSGNVDNVVEWSKKELLAYLLIYISNLDLKESRKECEYMLSRVDKNIYNRMHKKFETDSDYQCIQNIIKALKIHDYYRNDYADLFADIKLMAYADGDYSNMEQMLYSHLEKILRHA